MSAIPKDKPTYFQRTQLSTNFLTPKENPQLSHTLNMIEKMMRPPKGVEKEKSSTSWSWVNPPKEKTVAIFDSLSDLEFKLENMPKLFDEEELIQMSELLSNGEQVDKIADDLKKAVEPLKPVLKFIDSAFKVMDSLEKLRSNSSNAHSDHLQKLHEEEKLTQMSELRSRNAEQVIDSTFKLMDTFELLPSNTSNAHSDHLQKLFDEDTSVLELYKQ